MLHSVQYFSLRYNNFLILFASNMYIRIHFLFNRYNFISALRYLLFSQFLMNRLHNFAIWIETYIRGIWIFKENIIATRCSHIAQLSILLFVSSYTSIYTLLLYIVLHILHVPLVSYIRVISIIISIKYSFAC